MHLLFFDRETRSIAVLEVFKLRLRLRLRLRFFRLYSKSCKVFLIVIIMSVTSKQFLFQSFKVIARFKVGLKRLKLFNVIRS